MLVAVKRQNFKWEEHGFGYGKPQLCDFEKVLVLQSLLTYVKRDQFLPLQ